MPAKCAAPSYYSQYSMLLPHTSSSRSSCHSLCLWATWACCWLSLLSFPFCSQPSSFSTAGQDAESTTSPELHFAQNIAQERVSSTSSDDIERKDVTTLGFEGQHNEDAALLLATLNATVPPSPEMETEKNGALTPQYNEFQSAYDLSRQKPIALVEKENVRTAIAPFITNARVLELACGSGFYTFDLMRWGAASVLAADISDVMVGEAIRRVPEDTTGMTGIQFMVADCCQPFMYPGAPFDLVFAAWLLDNAPDAQTLTDIFRNVSGNLRPGGHFVTVTAAPTSDPRAFIREKNRLFPAPDGAGGVVYKILGEVPDGLHILVHGDNELGSVNIDCYYLRREVIESAARAGGMCGWPQWAVTVVPDSFFAKAAQDNDSSLLELQNYALVPQYGILKLSKE